MLIQIPLFPFSEFSSFELLNQIAHLPDDFRSCALGVLIRQIDQLGGIFGKRNDLCIKQLCNFLILDPDFLHNRFYPSTTDLNLA